MAARKRRALERIGSLSVRHQVRDLDALRDAGALSLSALASELRPGGGLVVITEGLTGYLSPHDLAGLWRRIATVAGGFRAGRYLSDLHLGGSPPLEVRVGRRLLSAFVRGGVYLHFSDGAHAETALYDAGFATARVTPARAPGAGRETMAHTLEASTTDRGRR